MEEVKALETWLVLNRWLVVAYPPPPPRSFICSFDWLLISFLDWPADIWSLSYGKDLSHWRIQGRDPGPLLPLLIFRPNGGPRGRKIFFETAASRISGSGWSLPTPHPPPLSEGLDPPLLAVALGSSHSRKYRLTIVTWLPKSVISSDINESLLTRSFCQLAHREFISYN